MADLQIKGRKVAFLDSNDNIIYTLPDSAGPAGSALVVDAAGKIYFGGIDLDAVLATGDSSDLDLTVRDINANKIEAGVIINENNIAFFEGETTGYSSGGRQYSLQTKVIEKFPFASDTNAVDVGDTIVVGGDAAGQSSNTHGYISGGQDDITGTTKYNNIEKFPFSSDANSSDVGDLTQTRTEISGQSSFSHGYSSGGNAPPQTTAIDKFPFSADANATDVGDLSLARESTSGQSSASDGYVSGGFTGIPPFTIARTDEIDRFPFASDANSTEIATLNTGRTSSVGTSSSTHGYASGGVKSGILSNIEKFPFATAFSMASIVADLTDDKHSGSGQSSTTHGYFSGGRISPTAFDNVILKFTTATDANATDVGDLTDNYEAQTGQQV